MDTRRCNKCKQVLPLSLFPRRSAMEIKYGRTCKKCLDKQLKKIRNETPPREYQFNKNKPWTLKDLKYLSDNIHLSAEELAYSLGRSVGTIHTKKSQVKKMKHLLKEVD